MRLSMKIFGLTEVLNYLRNFARNTPRKVEKGMLKGGNRIMSESKRIVPYDTGHLHDSALPPKITKTSRYTVEMSLAYGKHATEQGYFLYVHEDLNTHHTPPTQAKFLERPVREQFDNVKQIIKTEITG